MEEKLPKSALSLYVKLYCKRKSDTNSKYRSNLVEATKSWLSLSLEEKQQFADKLEECRVKFKHRFADYLKNVEPYLKKKSIKSAESTFQDKQIKDNLYNIVNETADNSKNSWVPNDKSDQTCNIPNAESTLQDNQIKDYLYDIVNETADNNKNCWFETFMENDTPEHLDNRTEQEEACTDPLPEPVPPSAKSAKELFNIVKSMDSQNNKSWEELSSQEKQRYRSAVLAIKKDYIVKYKDYLESLPTQQLFEYYNKAS